jgi:hypothetical protein
MLAVSRDGKTAVIIDYKFGHVSVSAEENAQLMFYALCADVDPATADMLQHAETLVFAIVQPNGDGPDLDVWEAPISVLNDFEKKVYKAIDETKDDKKRVHVAGNWCKYCPALATCPIKTGVAQAALRLSPVQAKSLSESLALDKSG